MAMIWNGTAITPARVNLTTEGGGWGYRREVTITEETGGDLTNFQVPIDVDFLEAMEGGKVNSDFSDVRVRTSDGVTDLDFYREYEGDDFGNFDNWWLYQENPVLTLGAGGTWDDYWVHPGSIFDVSGTLYLYYGGSDDAGTGSPNKIGLATGTDGITWTKHGSNPLLSPGAGGAWDDTKVDHACVIREDATTWKMWYGGYDGVTTWKVGYATSADGITWSKSGSNPIMAGTGGEWDSGFVIPSQVWEDGGTYYMVYWGGTALGTSSTWAIGLATSADGLTWSKSGSNPILDGVDSTWEHAVLDVHVEQIGSTYYMFYQGNTSDGQNSAIGVATSTDLVTWSKDGDNPMSRGANSSEWDYAWMEGPLLYQMSDGTWFMYYLSFDGASGNKEIGINKFKPTRLWVEVPSIPASDTVTIYVYYGNSEAADASDGATTFPDFFEDFADLTQWTNTGSWSLSTDRGDAVAIKNIAASGWYPMESTATIDTPFILESRAKAGADCDIPTEDGFRYLMRVIGSTVSPDANAVELANYRSGTYPNHYLMRRRAGSVLTDEVTEAIVIHADVWTGLRLIVPSTGDLIGEYHDDAGQLTITDNSPVSTYYIQIACNRVGEGFTSYFDKVWKREYASTEPTVSVGAEESL